MKNYRVVKDTYYLSSPPSIHYTIEKRISFLIWSWWSRTYKFDDDCYTYADEKNAIKQCDLLNADVHYKREVIYGDK